MSFHKKETEKIEFVARPGALSRHKMARTSWVWENRWIDLTHFRPRLGLDDWWLLEADLRLMGPLATGLKWKMTGSTPLE